MSAGKGEAWTKPYYGITHLGKFGTETFWCSIMSIGGRYSPDGWIEIVKPTLYELTKWFPMGKTYNGKGKHYLTEDFKSLEAAKKEAEEYLQRNIGPSFVLGYESR